MKNITHTLKYNYYCNGTFHSRCLYLYKWWSWWFVTNVCGRRRVIAVRLPHNSSVRNSLYGVNKRLSQTTRTTLHIWVLVYDCWLDKLWISNPRSNSSLGASTCPKTMTTTIFPNFTQFFYSLHHVTIGLKPHINQGGAIEAF